MVKRLWPIVVTLLLAVIVPSVLLAQPAVQDEFVPVRPGDLQEQIPAARLVLAAYAIVWLVFAFYLLTVWRRISRVEAELRTVTAKLERNGR